MTPRAYLTPVSFPLEAEAICDKCGEVFTAGHEVKEPGVTEWDYPAVYFLCDRCA